MSADEVQWTSKPDADRANRLMRLLFDVEPDADEANPDSVGGES